MRERIVAVILIAKSNFRIDFVLVLHSRKQFDDEDEKEDEDDAEISPIISMIASDVTQLCKLPYRLFSPGI